MSAMKEFDQLAASGALVTVRFPVPALLPIVTFGTAVVIAD